MNEMKLYQAYTIVPSLSSHAEGRINWVCDVRRSPLFPYSKVIEGLDLDIDRQTAQVLFETGEITVDYRKAIARIDECFSASEIEELRRFLKRAKPDWNLLVGEVDLPMRVDDCGIRDTVRTDRPKTMSGVLELEVDWDSDLNIQVVGHYILDYRYYRRLELEPEEIDTAVSFLRHILEELKVPWEVLGDERSISNAIINVHEDYREYVERQASNDAWEVGEGELPF